jgi:succinylarginine dihydrolase
VFAAQNPDVIDQGVFHNDVIAVGNGNVLFYHEQAFADEAATLDTLRRALAGVDAELAPIRVDSGAVPVADAVASYLFNSQLLTRADGKMGLVVPHECRENAAVARYLEQLVASGGPVDELIEFDLRQSMRNGGGPACLRLRVPLTAAERAAVNPKCWLDAARYAELTAWVAQHYRDRLVLADLADPALLEESRAALDALTRILGLGALYDFQRS